MGMGLVDLGCAMGGGMDQSMCACGSRKKEENARRLTNDGDTVPLPWDLFFFFYLHSKIQSLGFVIKPYLKERKKKNKQRTRYSRSLSLSTDETYPVRCQEKKASTSSSSPSPPSALCSLAPPAPAPKDPYWRLKSSWRPTSLGDTEALTVLNAVRKSASRTARTSLFSRLINFAPSARRGHMDASFVRSVMSAPEKPSAFLATLAMSSSLRVCGTSFDRSRCVTMCTLPPMSGNGMYNRFSIRRLAASSSSSGRFVAPTTKILSSEPVPAPSSWTRNSFLRRRVWSCSPSERAVRSESISSMNITAGCLHDATANNARTIFSPSPTHFDISELALILKKVEALSEAIAFPIIVFPVPGGPKRRSPLAGRRIPWNRSGRMRGHIIASLTASFAWLSPMTSSHFVLHEVSTSLHMDSRRAGSTFLSLSGTLPSASSRHSGIAFSSLPPLPPPSFFGGSLSSRRNGGTNPRRDAPSWGRAGGGRPLLTRSVSYCCAAVMKPAAPSPFVAGDVGGGAARGRVDENPGAEPPECPPHIPLSVPPRPAGAAEGGGGRFGGG
eukprot:Hpha_TRINITY_DN22635_c0_g1::TRINITY_DN22635_c0_g1_i1::g.192678::m.192678